MRTTKMMKTGWILLICVLSICPSEAKSEFGWGTGFGLQYAGIIGLQGSFKIENTKLKLSIGYLGLSGGIEQMLSDRFSIGYQTFAVIFSTGWGLYGNYYIATDNGNSWVIGLDFIRNVQTSFITATSEDSNKFLVSIGYNF